jgi:hypothetical protein
MKSSKILVVVLFSFSLMGQALGQTAQRPQVTPLVAEFEREKHQVLPDGNTINKVEKGPYYRDRYGRTRVESNNLIVINDPVTGMSYILDSQQRTARVIDRNALMAQAKQVRTSERTLGIDRNKLDDPAAILSAQSTSKPAANVTTSPGLNNRSLGNKMIEGVNCDGKLFTVTVPANSKMGNARPLESSTEIWIAKDLMLPILSVNEHPLMGKIVQRFTNIRLGVEPDPSLFKLPEGFKVVDK